MRTIRVTGKGRIKRRPDTTRLLLSLEGRAPEYSETLRRSAEETETLRAILPGLGFERTALKTLEFSAEPEVESERRRDGSYRQRLVGYDFRHRLKLEFSSDSDRLGRLLYALAHCGVEPEFRIEYTVSDPEGAMNELLGRAVADAREKAAVLARAGGVELGEIQSIDYSWGEIDLSVDSPVRMLALSECAVPGGEARSLDLDVEPEEIDVSDTATVIWEIR